SLPDPARTRLRIPPCARSSNSGWHGSGPERVQLVVAVVDDPVAGLRHLVPGAGEVAQRLRHDQPGLPGDPAQGGSHTTNGVSSATWCRMGLSGYSWRRVCILVL